MKNIVRLFADDKQGSAAIVTALSMVALLGFTALLSIYQVFTTRSASSRAQMI